MNNNELDKILKSALAPERRENYWREFPKRVTAKLHWRGQASTAPAPRPARKFNPAPAWAVVLAVICVVAGFLAKTQKQSSARAAQAVREGQLMTARKCYQEFEALFPHQLRAIVFDQQGPHLLLAPKADVPASAPLYLKICGPKGCEDFVTFSGQQIPFNGENCEVLENGNGQVMLVGNHQVWAGENAADAVRIQARML
jgi:hypothetical protein